MKFKSRRRLNQDMGLNITSMMDMFTIILVFLLKSFGSNSVELKLAKDINLPSSISQKVPSNILSLIVSKNSILLDDKYVLDHVNGKIPSGYLDDNNLKIIPLYKKFKYYADIQKNFSPEKTKKISGKILLQMDKNLSFEILRQIMYTAGLAGFDNFKFLTIKKE